MARPKKHPRLPNGFGSIKKLSGKNRRNPYGVYPPTEEFDENGVPVKVQALAYVNDWYYGFSILLAHKAGTYIPGIYPAPPSPNVSYANMDNTISAIIKDYNQVRASIVPEADSGPTFEEVYMRFYEAKYNNPKRNYSKSAMYQTACAFKHCSSIHHKPFSSLRHSDLQKIVDECNKKYATLETIVSLFHQMYAYADVEGLIDKDYSDKVQIHIADDNEAGVPFTEDELKILWANENDPTVEFILIMCYSGFRISAYKTMKVNLEENYFFGGIKTKASKKRTVPIHPGIRHLVQRRIERDGSIFEPSANRFRVHMDNALAKLGIQRHTPHDCRHTFSWLCEHFEVKENDRKRMLGHSFGPDITNEVYGHRTLEELREEICKIQVCR